MLKTFYLVVVLMLTSGMGYADSIQIGGKYYQDVYIGVTTEYYYVHHPEEGRMEKVSRRRSNISDVLIDSDGAARERLLEQFKAHRTGGGVAKMAQSTVPKALGGARNQLRVRLKALAVFEAQVEHWRYLSPEAQQRIQEDVAYWSEQSVVQRRTERETTQGRLQQLDSKKIVVEEKFSVAESERQAALDRAREESDEAFYLERYDHSVVRYPPYYQYYTGWNGDVYVQPFYRYGRDRSLYDAAAAERDLERRKVGAAESTYVHRVASHERELNMVHGAISKREQDIRSIESKSRDEGIRYGGFQARIDDLILAVEEKYRPRLHVLPVASWRGVVSQRTDTFFIADGLWRLDCIRQDSGLAGDFSITVFDADSEQPFTRISGVDFLRMRTRVFHKTGNFYLVIEQDINALPYEIKVSALAERAMF